MNKHFAMLRGTLSHQELSDRAQIADLLFLEITAIDERDWDMWQQVYTEDALIDWSEAGAIKGNPAEVRRYAEGVLDTFPYPAYQHLCSNLVIRIDGDVASCRSMQYIAVPLPDASGTRQMSFQGIWFEDRLRRTADGWRIFERIERLAWRHNFPEGYVIPDPLKFRAPGGVA